MEMGGIWADWVAFRSFKVLRHWYLHVPASSAAGSRPSHRRAPWFPNKVTGKGAALIVPRFDQRVVFELRGERRSILTSPLNKW